MQHSDAPWNELRKAETELAAMRAATDVRVVRDHWIQFLHAIERVWSKSAAHYGKSPKWSNWHKAYLDQRRADPLLSYLVNARGAEEHTVEEVANPKPGSILIRGNSSGAAYVERLRIEQGRVVEYRGDQPLEMSPAHVELRTVVNRGKSYPPPTSHLGAPLAQDVHACASAALAYYSGFLRVAEAKFVDSCRS